MSADQAKPEKEPSGCLLKGCLGVLVVGAFLLVAFGWGAYTLFEQVKSLAYTEPAPVPEFQVRPEVWESFDRRWQEAAEEWQAGRPATLAVSQDDLNTLIQHGLRESGSPAKLYAQIEGGAVRLQTSAPLDWIQGYEGLYFNGTLELVPRMTDGEFFIELKGMEAGSVKAPPQFMETQKYFDWASGLDELGLRQPLDLLDRIEIRDGQLLLIREADAPAGN
ncbi:MAG: hypothetical protein AAGK14_03795 [Verrucomicrobiota bacterium]